MSGVTRFLKQIGEGDPHAAEQLLPLVYEELRKLAAARLANESPGHTLQATALVHEAYLRLVGPGLDSTNANGQSWDHRGHFFAAAAEAMRRILVEAARHKQSQKAGGNWERLELAQVEPAAKRSRVDILALHEALDKLQQQDPRKAQLVKLRYFAGLTNAQAAAALDISTSTADNDWAYAKNWLRVEISKDLPG